MYFGPFDHFAEPFLEKHLLSASFEFLQILLPTAPDALVLVLARCHTQRHILLGINFVLFDQS